MSLIGTREKATVLTVYPKWVGSHMWRPEIKSWKIWHCHQFNCRIEGPFHIEQ